MPDPFLVSCPHCSKRLKLRDKSKLGKKVKCPKCSKPFVLKVNEPEEDDEDFLSGINDLEQDYSDDTDDDYEELPTNRRRKSSATSSRKSSRGAGAKRSSKKKKTSKKKSHSNNAMIFGIIGGVAALLMVGSLAGYLVFSRSNVGSLLAYLPAKSDCIVRIDLDKLRKNPELKKELNKSENFSELGEFFEEIDLKISDISSLTLGIDSLASTINNSFGSGTEKNTLRFLVVLDFNREVTIDDFIPKKTESTKSSHPSRSDLFKKITHQEKQVLSYTGGPEELYLYLPESQKAVMGTKEAVTAMIDQGDNKQERSAFEFVDWNSAVAFCFAPQNPRPTFGQAKLDGVPFPMPASVSSLASEFSSKAEAVGITLDINTKIDFNILLKCADSSAPTKIKTSLDDLVKIGKKELETLKSSPQLGSDPETKKGLSVLQLALDTLKIEPSGKLLTVALSSDIPTVPSGSSRGGLMSSLSQFTEGFQEGKKSAQGTSDRNNMKQIGLAMHNYHDTFRTFPGTVRKDKSGKPLLSWRVSILPFIDQSELYKKFHLNEPWDSPHNIKLLDEMPAVFNHQLTERLSGMTIYRVIQAPGSIFENGKEPRIRDIIDGTSNTILLVQGNQKSSIEWTAPDPFEMSLQDGERRLYIDSDASGKFVNFLLADGSVRKLHLSFTPDIKSLIKALITRNGDEKIPDFN